MKKQKTQQKQNIFHKPPFKLSASAAMTVSEERDDVVLMEMPIFPVGSFMTHHDIPEGFDIDDETIRGFIESFRLNIPQKHIPVYVGHDETTGRPARGWVTELINKGRHGLWGVVELTKTGAQLVKDRSYKYISPEWSFDFIDPRSGAARKNVLQAISLVNEPYFLMPALTASKKRNINIIKSNMNLEELSKKAVDELTVEEKAYLLEHKSELDELDMEEGVRETLYSAIEPEKSEGDEDDDKDAEGKEKDEEKPDADKESGDDKDKAKSEESTGDEDKAKAEEEGDSKKDAEAGTKDDEKTDEKPDVVVVEEGAESTEGVKATASLKGVSKNETITASVLKGLRKESKELKSMKLTAAIEKAGILPGAKESVESFLNQIDSKLHAQFFNLVGKTKASIKTDRIGSPDKEGDKELTAREQLEQKVAKVKEKEGISTGDAWDKVAAEHPELNTAVQE